MSHVTVTTIQIEATGTWTFDSLKTVGGTDIPVKTNTTLVTADTLPETLAGTTVKRYISGDWNTKAVLKATYAGHQVSFPFRLTRGQVIVIRLTPDDLTQAQQETVDANAGGSGGVTPLTSSDFDIDSTMAANSDVKIPSQKAVKTALATKPTATLDTDSTMAANSDTVLATQKATKTALATKPTATLDTDSTMAANSDTVVATQKATKTALATKPTATLDTDGTFAANSATRVPSQSAVVTGLATKPTAVLDTDTALAANLDTKVASQKAVKAYADAIAALKMNIADDFLTQHTLLAANGDPAFITGSTILTSGTVYACRMVARISGNATKIWYNVATGGSTLTAGQNLCGIANSSGTLLQTSVDQTTNFGGTTNKSATITSQAIVAGSVYYVLFLSVGTTPPTISRFSNSAYANVNVSAAQLRWGIVATSQTTLATFTPSSLTSTTTDLACAVSV